MSTRNRLITRHLLNDILKEGNGLRGSRREKTSVVQQAVSYLALLKLAPQTKSGLPPSLNETVRNLRRIAADKKLVALSRLKAIRKLLVIEGIELPAANRNGQEIDAVEDFIRQEMNIARPERITKTFQEQRAEQRRQALYEIKTNFLRDHNEGRFRGMSAEQIAEWLRLDDMEPAPVKVDSMREFDDALEAVLQRAKGEQ